MIKWGLSEYDYDQLVGRDFETIASGEIEIQAVDNPGSDSISIPFLGWWPSATYGGSPHWWENYDLTVTESLDELRFIQLRLDETPSKSYYLVVPELDIDPFIPISGAQIESDSYDLFYEGGVIDQLLNEYYQLANIVGVELDLPDLVEHVNQPVSAGPPGSGEFNDSPVSVPEPSSAFGVLVFGIFFVGVILKRSLFRLAK